MDVDDNDSEELRFHIHHLLRDYSRAHFTVDYVKLTQDLVAEFVEGLKFAPLTDPYSSVIPPDPYEQFFQMHGLSSLAPYDEIVQTPKEVYLYLKDIMNSELGIPKTDWVISDDTYIRDAPYEPIFVALSRQSRQSTPKLGSKKQTHSPNLHRDVKALRIGPIQIEEIEDPPLSTSKILQLTLLIDDEDLTAVKSLLQSTSNILRQQDGYKNYCDPTFLRDDSSASDYKLPEFAFVPIFPRARPGTPAAPSSAGFKGLVDLPSKIVAEVAIAHSDDDIHMQNFEVVDGWETIRSSPLLTSSSANTDDSGDQIDELLLHSTPNTEPVLIEELFNSQMDVPQFPRSQRIGGNAGIKPHILAGNTLGSFLQPFLPKTTMQIDQEPVVEQRSSPEPSSLFGQPPSVMEHPEVLPYDVHCDVDVEIENLYQGQNLQDFIMSEVIDEKQSFLMEVPDLPEPNVYARKEITFPSKFPEFLIPPDANRGKCLQYQFLMRTRSKQSLTVGLSWEPADQKLPTITEAVGVTDLFDDPIALEVDLAKVEMTLRSVSFNDSPPNPAENLRFLGEQSSDHRPPDPDEDFKMLLNRNERRRVAKVEGRINDMKAYDSDCSVAVADDDLHSVGHVRSGSCDFDDAILRPAKRPRLDIVTDDNTDKEDYSSILSCVRETPLLLAPSTDMILDPDAHCDATGLDSDLNAFRRSEDREDKGNWPPPENGHHELEDEERFQPLSFESRLPESGPSSQTLNCFARSGLESNERQQDLSMDTLIDMPGFLVSKALESRSLDLPTNPEKALRHLGIQAFAQLRAKTISATEETQALVSSPIRLPTNQDFESREPPADIYDDNTARLPENIAMPETIHKYMASVDVIQKRALIGSLQERQVDLVERQSLNGVDLILDHCSAVIFLSLFTLASQCDKYVQRVSEQSWKFRRMLIIFEAYTQSCARKGNTASGSNSELYAYTPPIRKAIKRFRRDLSIATACGTKCEETRVFYAFADSVAEGAIFVRLYGDFVEDTDETGGAIWGEREWLDLDFLEEEEANLASANGINRFSASIILCQVSLEEFLNIGPEERISRFSRFIGTDALEKFNIDLEARSKALEILYTSE